MFFVIFSLLVPHFTPLCNFGPLSKKITKNILNVYKRLQVWFSIYLHPKTNVLLSFPEILHNLHPLSSSKPRKSQKTKTTNQNLEKPRNSSSPHPRITHRP